MATYTSIRECPCSGKNMGYFMAPWILLTLYQREGTHGYEIKKILKEYMKDLGISFNIAGLYRHLNQLEKRGVLTSEWDTPVRGPAKRRYYLTDEGRECLNRWTQTLYIQLELIRRFFDKAGRIFPLMPFLKEKLEFDEERKRSILSEDIREVQHGESKRA